MGAPAHPTTQLFLITMAEIKGNTLCNDQCFFSEVTVLHLFAWARLRVAHLDGRQILVFESSGTKWMWALRRGTSLPLVFMQHDLFITPHVCRSALWAVHMCWYVQCRPTPPCGFSSPQKVASSYMCEKREKGDSGGKNENLYIWME